MKIAQNEKGQKYIEIEDIKDCTVKELYDFYVSQGYSFNRISLILDFCLLDLDLCNKFKGD